MPIKRIESPKSDESLFEDEEETPTPQEKGEVIIPKSSKGFDKLKAAIKKSGRRGDTLSFPWDKGPQLIMFLDDGQSAVYFRHWIERTGRKSFRCAKDADRECPLCDLGDNPTLRVDWQVLHIAQDDNGDLNDEVKVITLSKTAAEILLNLDEDPRRGPLQGNWFLATRTGEGVGTRYSFDRQKDRDVVDDFGMPLDEINRLRDEYVGKTEYKEWPVDLTLLAKVASEIKGAV